MQPEDIDFAVSWDFHRFFEKDSGRQDPGLPIYNPERLIFAGRTCQTCQQSTFCTRHEANCLDWLPAHDKSTIIPRKFSPPTRFQPLAPPPPASNGFEGVIV